MSWDYYDLLVENFRGDDTVNLSTLISTRIRGSRTMGCAVSSPLTASYSPPSNNLPYGSGGSDTPIGTKYRRLERQRQMVVDREEKRLEELKKLRIAMDKTNDLVEE